MDQVEVKADVGKSGTTFLITAYTPQASHSERFVKVISGRVHDAEKEF